MPRKRAGADAADAVAVRSRVAVGRCARRQRRGEPALGRRRCRPARFRRPAPGGGVDQRHQGRCRCSSPQRAVAMARVAPEDPYAGLADPALLAKNFPDLDLLDPQLPGVEHLEALARARRRGGACGQGRDASPDGASASAGIGGMVLVTSTGFRGAYLGSRHGVSMTAIAGEGTGMERDYDYSSALHAADLDAPENVGRSAGERAVGRLNPRKVATTQGAGGVRSARRQLARRSSCRRHQRRGDRAQDVSFLKDASGKSCSPTASASSTIRCAPRPALASVRRRGRCGEEACLRRGRRADVMGARLRDRARTGAGDHRPRLARRLVAAVAVGSAISSRGRTRDARRTDRRHQARASTSPS